MTTPNIEELIKRLRDNGTACKCNARCSGECGCSAIWAEDFTSEAADALQVQQELLSSQAERIAELDEANTQLSKYCIEFLGVTYERDTLRAQLEQLVVALEFMWRDVPMNEYAFEKLEATITAGRAALDGAEPVNSYDLAKRADNWGQP